MKTLKILIILLNILIISVIASYFYNQELCPNAKDEQILSACVKNHLTYNLNTQQTYDILYNNSIRYHDEDFNTQFFYYFTLCINMLNECNIHDNAKKVIENSVKCGTDECFLRITNIYDKYYHYLNLNNDDLIKDFDIIVSSHNMCSRPNLKEFYNSLSFDDKSKLSQHTAKNCAYTDYQQSFY